jgi:transcriptional regulatory protein LevR
VVLEVVSQVVLEVASQVVLVVDSQVALVVDSQVVLVVLLHLSTSVMRVSLIQFDHHHWFLSPHASPRP